MKHPSVPSESAVWAWLDGWADRWRPYRQNLALLADVVMVALSWNLTYLFRLGFERWISARPGYDLWVMLALMGIYALALVLLKVPQGMWRFYGLGDIQRLAAACFSAGLLGALLVIAAQRREVPRAVLALHPVFALMGMAMMRMLWRMLYEHTRRRVLGVASFRRALVLGAGDSARLLIAGIQNQGWQVVGCLDDDPARLRTRIAGVPVLGELDEAARWAQAQAATHLIVALPERPRAARQRAFEIAADTGLAVLTLPQGSELRPGSKHAQVRDIEPEDLLGREPVQLDESGIAETLRGKTVLVTGAGGSIGSELCRQLARYQPARLVLYEQSEFNLYTIEQELSETWPGLALTPLIGDIRVLAHLRQTFASERPQIVFHAAAYKHVPLVEQHNAWAALVTNTAGTYQVGLAAAEAGCERFVLISTDKAVNPTNVMGATKRAAELVVSELAQRHPGTRFMAVRFGNVLGSSGSVIPKFKEQIARGGPVTVTHPDITRYFMTIPEAARLVVQAAVIGETGQVMVLEMGEAVRIADLAQKMIRMAGARPDRIGIVYTGLRPGEKLYEELDARADAGVPTRVAGIRLALLDQQGLSASWAQRWLVPREPVSDAEVRNALAELLPEYRPSLDGNGPRLEPDPNKLQQ